MGEELREDRPEAPPSRLTDLPVFVSGATFSRECLDKANERSSTWTERFEGLVKRLAQPVNVAAGFVLMLFGWYWSVVVKIAPYVFFLINIFIELMRYIPTAARALFESIVIVVFRIRFVHLLAETYLNLYCNLENMVSKYIPPCDEEDESPCSKSMPFYLEFIESLEATLRIPGRIFCHVLTSLLASFYTLIWALKTGENLFGANASGKFSRVVKGIRARDKKKGSMRRLFATGLEVSLGTLRFFLGRDVSLALGEQLPEGVQPETDHED